MLYYRNICYHFKMNNLLLEMFNIKWSYLFVKIGSIDSFVNFHQVNCDKLQQSIPRTEWSSISQVWSWVLTNNKICQKFSKDVFVDLSICLFILHTLLLVKLYHVLMCCWGFCYDPPEFNLQKITSRLIPLYQNQAQKMNIIHFLAWFWYYGRDLEVKLYINWTNLN